MQQQAWDEIARLQPSLPHVRAHAQPVDLQEVFEALQRAGQGAHFDVIPCENRFELQERFCYGRA